MGDETYCIYIEKSHAIFLIFTLVVIFIIAIISDNIVEAVKIIILAAIPIVTLVLIDHNNKKNKYAEAQATTIIAQLSEPAVPLSSIRPKTATKNKFKHYPGRIDDHDSDSDTDDEDAGDEPKFMKHGSTANYDTYGRGNTLYTYNSRPMWGHSADDYMAASRRNDPRREKHGVMERHRKVKNFVGGEFNEGRDWWGRHDY